MQPFSETIAYELMKISVVVATFSEQQAGMDFEDIWDEAKRIYELWEQDADKPQEEHAYIQKYAERLMQEQMQGRIIDARDI